MIVCLCNDIREADIQKMVEQGARTVRDVQAQCLAGTSCGSCVFAIKKCLKTQAKLLQNGVKEREADEVEIDRSA